MWSKEFEHRVGRRQIPVDGYHYTFHRKVGVPCERYTELDVIKSIKKTERQSTHAKTEI